MDQTDQTPQNEAPTKESTLLEWTAPEFIVYSRSLLWYLAAGVAIFAVLLYSVFTSDWFIAVLSIFIGVALFVNSKRQAKDVIYKITQLGLYMNGHFYPFTELHSFWLNLNSNQRILNIVFRKKYLPALPILFYGVDPLLVKTTLSKYIPEQMNRDETILDKLSRLLKI